MNAALRRLLIALSAAMLVPPGSASAVPLANGKLVVVDATGIALVDPDTGSRAVVYRGAAGSAAASPDGRRIAFAGCLTADECGILVINADGSGLAALPGDTAGAWALDRSPDGTRIAFTRASELFVVVVGSGLETQLTAIPDGSESEPTWSADGERIAFVLTRTPSSPPADPGCAPGEAGAADIWIVNADGTGARPLIATADCDLEPDFSSDGSWLVYGRSPVSTEPRFHESIWVAAADGSGGRQLFLSPPNTFGPVFSPDGTRVAFHVDSRSYDPAPRGIYTVGLEAGLPVLVPGTEAGAVWPTGPRWRRPHRPAARSWGPTVTTV